MKYYFIIILLLISVAKASDNKNLLLQLKIIPAGHVKITTTRIHGKIQCLNDICSAKEIWIRPRDLKTGIGLRDEHMYQKLEIKKYPKISFFDSKCVDGKGLGNLKIRSVTLPIEFKCKVVDEYLDVAFEISLKKYQIENISFAGISIEDTVKIEGLIPIYKEKKEVKN